ncbi:MAG: hypothetical protein K2G45_04230 [Lachnospiraceae bacterium]|nr:hypothetical protein [Lachnospiraceae bacterium]
MMQIIRNKKNVFALSRVSISNGINIGMEIVVKGMTNTRSLYFFVYDLECLFQNTFEAYVNIRTNISMPVITRLSSIRGLILNISLLNMDNVITKKISPVAVNAT